MTWPSPQSERLAGFNDILRNQYRCARHRLHDSIHIYLHGRPIICGSNLVPLAKFQDRRSRYIHNFYTEVGGIAIQAMQQKELQGRGGAYLYINKIFVLPNVLDTDRISGDAPTYPQLVVLNIEMNCI